MKSRNLKDYRVLVTPTTYGQNDPALRSQLETEVGEVVYNTKGRPLSSEELAEVIPEIDGYIAGLDSIDRKVIEAANRLKVIARYGVGIDSVDIEAAREKGIVVTNTPGANSSSVAELTVGLMLALARNLPGAIQATKAGGWPRMSGYSLEGKVIGLIGFGAIGQYVARIANGFRCKLIAYDPAINMTKAMELSVKVGSIDEVVRQADFVSLHAPFLPKTRGMVNAAFIGKMKRGAFLINTARGELVDERALLEALQNHHLAGVAMDCFSKQPPQADNPLLARKDVIVTPHMGAHTDGAMNAMGWMALADCLKVLRGEKPVYRV